MTSTELVELYIHRASRIFDVPTLESLRWRGLGAIHALQASGLLTYAQHAEAVNAEQREQLQRREQHEDATTH